jgi:hypothetical protein
MHASSIHHADWRRAATRCSVNVQCYERDHGPGFPLTVLFDDRLPRTAGSRGDEDTGA